MDLLLACGRTTQIDDDMADQVSAHRWRAISLVGASSLYVRRIGKYDTHSLLHRFVMQAERGQVVDHISGDALDNRRANLRICTQAENVVNRARQRNSTQPFKGIHKHRNRWLAYVGGQPNRQFVGSFDTAEAAARAYDKAATERFGQFARLNFPNH